MPTAKKIALVTGGTKGTGRAIVESLLQAGVHVVTNYHKDQAAAETFANEFQGQPLTIIQADLGEAEQVQTMWDQVEQEHGALDYFIANAAATAFKPLLDIKPHHLEKTFAITIYAFLASVQRCVSLMKGRSGKIVALSGQDSYMVMPKHGVLGAAKSALETLVRYLAVELAPHNINVNAINPGFIDSASSRFYYGDEYEEIKNKTIAATPNGQITSGKELADIVLFLCSEQANWLVGQTLRCDAGLSLLQPNVQISK